LQKYKAPHPNPPLIKGRELVSPLDKGGLRGVNSTFARGLLLINKIKKDVYSNKNILLLNKIFLWHKSLL
jgi:hypothetical protein